MVSSARKYLILSSYPPRECGIATFTKDLSDSIQKRFGNSIGSKIAAINESSSLLRTYPKKVSVTLTENDIASYEALAKKINRMKDVEVVNIQHEFGLFGGLFGSYLLTFMELLNKKIITTMHTVLEDPKQEMKEVVRRIFELSDKVVVMTENAKKILADFYQVDVSKVEVIPHGVPAISYEKNEKAKRKYGLKGKTVLMTFGMLSKGKSLETVINALPKVVKKFPDVVYLIVGQTHPIVRQKEGESYRNMLKELIAYHKLNDHVKFLDKYLTLKEIIECLQMADIYLAPSSDARQICSGTVSYAMGAGRAIIASRTKYNEEVLASNRGIIIKDNDPDAFSRAIIKLLRNQELRASLEKNAFEYSRKMTWQNISTKYFNTIHSLSQFEINEFGKLPRLNFKHFFRITDDFGMIQFCNYTTPDVESGYTLDDNARALVVSKKAFEVFGYKKFAKMAGKFLDFIDYCYESEGVIHNVVNYKREYADDIGSEDSYGRALWGLAETVESNMPSQIKERAKEILAKYIKSGIEVSSPRAEADSLIGLTKVMAHFPSEAETQEKLLDSLICKYNDSKDEEWKWFESYLTYANGRIPEALFEAHKFDKSGEAKNIAIESMDFLTKILFIEDKLFPIGQEKWYHRKSERSMFDQQPIEASVMTTAYIKAFESTGNQIYMKRARDSFDWFLGKNAHHLMVYDESSGGSFDGITRNGVNANQGAESTVSYLLARLSF